MVLHSDGRLHAQSAKKENSSISKGASIDTLANLEKSQHSLTDRLRELEVYIARNSTYIKELWNELERVRYLSLTDDYTGLPNRRAFLEKLNEEVGRAQRYDVQFALTLIDLDNFKAVNDLYGHAAGDKVLCCYATNVLSEIRYHDVVARYGGEEFAVMFPNTDKEGALKALKNVRKRAAMTSCEVKAGKLIPAPTFSAGLTVYMPGEPAEMLITRADKALYRAKALGRDRVEVELPLPAQAAESN